MTSWANNRLAELGVTLPELAPPLASYIPAVRSGNIVFTSGQLPMVGGSLVATGKVGDAVTIEQAAECARICALNGLAAIDHLVGLDSIARIVRVVGYVAAAPGFTEMPAVINGASDLLNLIFGGSGAHARTAIGVAVLPLDAPVELELMVEVVLPHD